jgi:hypothetical protein
MATSANEKEEVTREQESMFVIGWNDYVGIMPFVLSITARSCGRFKGTELVQKCEMFDERCKQSLHNISNVNQFWNEN